MKKKLLSLVLALALSMGLAAPAFAAGPTFSDVPKSNWAYTYVEKAAEKGWISGNGMGGFSPNDDVTYAQLCVMLTKAFFGDELAAYTGAKDPWFRMYTTVANNEGLLDGTGIEAVINDAKYAEHPMMRFDMAQMVYDTMVSWGAITGSPDMNTAAKTTADWDTIPDRYRPAVATVKNMGIISGVDNKGTFSGGRYMTRAQAAVVMTKLNEILSETPRVTKPEPEKPVPVYGKVGTMSDSPVTLSLETHKPISDYWSQQSAEVRNLTDKDCFNAAVQSLADAEMIINQGQHGTASMDFGLGTMKYSNINLYYNYALFGPLDAKALYKDWPAGIRNVHKAMTLSGLCLYDNSSYRAISSGMTDVLFNPQKTYKADELAAIFAPVFAKFPANATDKQKAEICMQAVVDRFDYETGKSGFDWFSGTTGNCESYYRAISQILSASGIPNIRISGDTSLGAHAWNQVYLDGQWYIMDGPAVEKGWDKILTFSQHEQIYGYPHSKNEWDEVKVARAIIETVAELKG